MLAEQAIVLGNAEGIDRLRVAANVLTLFGIGAIMKATHNRR